MRKIIIIALFLLTNSCQKDFTQEKFIQNDSSDTLTIVNPDFDTTYTILPGFSAMIYSFKVLDTKQEKEDCKWLGDTLVITNQDDSICKKIVTLEDNWSTVIGGPDKERLQKCTFYVTDNDF